MTGPCPESTRNEPSFSVLSSPGDIEWSLGVSRERLARRFGGVFVGLERVLLVVCHVLSVEVEECESGEEEVGGCEAVGQRGRWVGGARGDEDVVIGYRHASQED